MTRRTRQVMETLSGRGQVCRHGQAIAAVLYRLDVMQEYVIIEDFSGTQKLPGHRDLSGSLRVLSGENNLFLGEGPLMLCLEDGRRVEVLVESQSPGSSIYHVAGSGGFIAPEEQGAGA